MASDGLSPPSEVVRVLVAEDNPDVREFIMRALVSSGYEVSGAIDGQEALEVLSQARFDVLVSDIVMPNLDGVALAMMVGPLYPQMRIVLVSGYAQERMRAHNLEALVHKVIAKPFSLEEIVDAVKNVLRMSSTICRLSSKNE